MKAIAPSDGAMPFIVTTSSERYNHGKLRSIRSHVMRGKNRKKLPAKPSSWMNDGANRDYDVTKKDLAFYIPTKVGGEFSLTLFSAEMTPKTLETIRKLRYAMFPLEFSMASEQNEASWFEPIWKDRACLHLTLFTTNTYLGAISGHKKNHEAALVHFSEVLSILQSRLDCTNHDISTSSSTILIVIGLTMAATALGDFEAASKHLAGGLKMVGLRGGLSAFKGNIMFQSKICRADLEIAIGTGRNPLMFDHEISWDSYIAMPNRQLYSKSIESGVPRCVVELTHFIHNLDMRLHSVWDDLSEFVRSTNVATQSKCNIDGDLYLEVMVSIHYRLIKLHYDKENACGTFRLGLLAFASTLFLQWRVTKTRFEHLAQELGSALSRLECETDSMPVQVQLWLHVIGAVCVFNDPEAASLLPALTGMLYNMGLKSWDDVKKVMKSILWLDFLHDNQGEKIVNAALRRPWAW